MDSNELKEKWDFYLERLKEPGFYQENKKLITKIFTSFLFVLFVIFFIFFAPPQDFPLKKIIRIEEGGSVSGIASFLEQQNIIKSTAMFKVLVVIKGNQKDLIAGDYFFEKKLSLTRVLNRLSKGDYDISPTDVVFPEGVTVAQIGKILKSNFENFKEEEFLRLAKDKEGFLFPDTYKFLPNVGPRQVISDMESNFNQKIEPLLVEIEESGHSVLEIITMASLLEEEARTRETREIISGILWNRIEIDMALQVDAVFTYIMGRHISQVLFEDLEIDSPYNTYKYKGLPPGAISNPGLSSIESALRPAGSNYFFYLSDRNGTMHYAQDFDGHKINRGLYLD